MNAAMIRQTDNLSFLGVYLHSQFVCVFLQSQSRDTVKKQTVAFSAVKVFEQTSHT